MIHVIVKSMRSGLKFSRIRAQLRETLHQNKFPSIIAYELGQLEIREFQEYLKETDDMRTYKSSYQISDMLNSQRFHKRNSASIYMEIKDFYITACTRTPIFVAKRIQRHVQWKVSLKFLIMLNTSL